VVLGVLLCCAECRGALWLVGLGVGGYGILLVRAGGGLGTSGHICGRIFLFFFPFLFFFFIACPCGGFWSCEQTSTLWEQGSTRLCFDEWLLRLVREAIVCQFFFLSFFPFPCFASLVHCCYLVLSL